MQAQLTKEAKSSEFGMGISVSDAASNDLEWVRWAQNSDSGAFEMLYRAHIDRVYGLCLRMTAEAEDYEQDAFIQAWN
ncbi:MAG: RNA polymerase sigma factor [Woeseiales bacterium]